MKDKKSHVIAVKDRYERREILHDCGHMKDMKKKSYTTVIIHNHERREILRDCGYTAGLCQTFQKVRWYTTIKDAV